MIIKRFRLAVRFVPVLLLVIAMSMTAGCTNNHAGKSENGAKLQNYSSDGYLGTSNANPHMQGRNKAVGDAADAEAMQQAIRNMRGIAGANVMLNGPDAYVTLKIVRDSDARQVPTIEREAAAALRFNFPRYTIHVRSITK